MQEPNAAAYSRQTAAPIGRFAVETAPRVPSTSGKGVRHVTFGRTEQDGAGRQPGASTRPPPLGQRQQHPPSTAAVARGEDRTLHRVPASDSALSGLPPRAPPTFRQNQNRANEWRAEEQTSRDSEEQFVDGNYFFNHLVRERAAEDFNVASVLREKDRDRRKHGQFGPAADFATVGAGRGIDRLSTSLPVEGYYYYHNQPQRQHPHPHHLHHRHHHHHRRLPAQVFGSDADVGLPEVPFAGGLEIEIPPRRHAGLGGGGLRTVPDSAGGDDRLLMVPDTHRREPSTRFGRDYFRATEPSAGYRGAQQHPPPPLHRPTVIRPANNQFAKDDLPPPPTTSAYLRPQQFNSYNVRTGRFQPDPEQLLPPPKPPPKLGRCRNDVDGDAANAGGAGRINHGAEVSEEDQNEWPLPARRRPILPRPHPDLTRFASEANVRRSLPGGDDVVADPRLSVSYDPTRTSLRPMWRDTSEAVRSHPVAETSTNRKVVTWQDQTVDATNTSASRVRPAADDEAEGVHRDNRAFVSDLPENNGDGNNVDSTDNTTASSQDNTGSFSRDVVSYPINLSLSRSLLINDLENVDQFALFEVSTSKLCWAESFTGSSWLDRTKQYKFVVLNRQEEVLFIGTEEDGAISNCIISPHKSSFRVRLLDANGHDVIHFRRLYPVKTKANFNYGQKNKYRLEVVTPSGHVIGNVEKTYDSDTYYVLEDRAGECLFLVQRSCICTCPLFWDYEFKILMPDNEEEVGDISWSYLTCQKEQFNGTEISFPIELNATSKIMLLGVCFLLNFSRWQSSYLDALYNPRRRKGKEAADAEPANREVDALLHTSPNEGGDGGRGARGGLSQR